MFGIVISLVLRDSDTDAENLKLIRRSVSDGQKSGNSNGVSLIERYMVKAFSQRAVVSTKDFFPKQ